ncbi:hypothetical protein BEH94_00820 [Candidatus Altiarchaeales archaeon WOR_SM1_SCG]|nr:hypothetical protein BEH94_00820 [Candidatus Altiarchaeales archaeon WOR_SM1_SCG]
MFEIYLPIANITVNALHVIILGGLVGFLAGLFGVGGGFIMTPALNIVFGIPMNVAVGSDLTQIAATSSSGAVAHKRMGNVDIKLAVLILCGSVIGVQIGVIIVNYLRDIGMSDLVIKGIYVVMLTIIGSIMIVESYRAMRRRHEHIGISRAVMGLKRLPDVRSMDDFQRIFKTREKSVEQEYEFKEISEEKDEIKNPVIEKLRNIKFMSIELPKSGVRIPLFVPPLIGLFVGIMAGILGVGGGFIMVPVMIYVLGIPTVVAIGTDLFQMVITSSSGSIGHALSGNVDIYLVIMILIGSTIGAQFGAKASKTLKGPRIRLLFGVIIAVVMLRLLMDVLTTTGII